MHNLTCNMKIKRLKYVNKYGGNFMKELFMHALIVCAGLVGCDNNSSSTSNTPDSSSTTSETTSSSSVDETTSSSSPEELSTTKDPFYNVFGTWHGTLIGYDEEDEENMDDIENVIIEIEEDLSGSYRGKEVTWTYFDNEELSLFGNYRYMSPNGDFDVLCSYNVENDTLNVKWRNFDGGDYKIGTFTK